MKLHYQQKILEQLSEEQIEKLKAGQILRRCQRCREYFTCESKNVETKCPFCHLEVGEKHVTRKDYAEFKKATEKNTPLKYR